MTRAEIARRLGELSEQIRCYSGPSAPGGERLRALLQETIMLMQLLEQRAGGCTPLGIWDNEGGFHAA